jgi:hypothetical protein
MKTGLWSFVFLLAACTKVDEPIGIVVKVLDLGYCLSPKEYIIDSDTAYQTFKAKADCENVLYPNIDFSKYSLIGKSTKGGCRATFETYVLSNSDDRTYEHTTIVKTKGLCKELALDISWVLVPKLPAGWTVVFKTIKR